MKKQSSSKRLRERLQREKKMAKLARKRAKAEATVHMADNQASSEDLSAEISTSEHLSKVGRSQDLSTLEPPNIDNKVVKSSEWLLPTSGGEKT